MSRYKYNLLNAAKLFAAFLVVTIHIHFPGDFGKCVIAVARIAVPFFFMVSGFFCYYEDKSVISAKMKHKVKHIACLAAGALLFYFLFYSVTTALNGDFLNYIKTAFSWKSIFNLAVFNHPYISEPLWFLFALFYTYIVFIILQKLNFVNKSAFLIPVLSVGGVALREISDYITLPFSTDFAFLYRNFLFVGVPFFLMGYFIRVNKEKILEKFSTGVLILMTAAGFCESVLVQIFHNQKSVYLGTIVAVFAVFVMLIKFEDRYDGNKLASLGEKYSLYIYILQTAVNVTVKGIASFSPTAELIVSKNPIRPITMFALILLISILYVKIQSSVRAAFSSKIR